MFAQPTADRSTGRWSAVTGERDRRDLVTFALVLGVVAASFLGHYVFTLAGYSVRLEQIAPVPLAGWLLVNSRDRASFFRVLRHPVVLMFGAFIAWNVIATLLSSPSLSKSASILVWLAIDLLLLAAVMSLGVRAVWVENIGIRCVVPWAVAGFAAFMLANASGGGITLGTNFDLQYQVFVARVTAQEPNIYASILVLWTLLLLARKGTHRAWMIAVAVAVPLGIIGSQTRTAMFCMVLGLVVYVTYEYARWYKDRSRSRTFLFGPAALLVGVVVAFGVATMLPSFGEDALRAKQAKEATSDVDTPAVASQGKLGDIDLEGGNVGFRMKVAETAAEDLHGVHLWFGNGTNTFSLRHDQPGSPGVPGHIIMLPVQVLYDCGIVGLLLLVGLGVAVLRSVPVPRRPIAYAVVVAFTAAATMTSMFWFSVTWLIVAALVRPMTEKETAMDGAARRDTEAPVAS
ncbi:MAG: hypothetical protein WAW17_13250 [Rhodococcus sp. (in: high G+C Gram-positive bacteria)]|uniref:hypothetical protein n=1 Tax=Rhodococcus sp. TaxID=1831 RepID=UPI003BAE3058